MTDRSERDGAAGAGGPSRRASRSAPAQDSGASIHPFPLEGDLWAPDLSRRGLQDEADHLADATLELLQDWQAARAAARR